MFFAGRAGADKPQTPAGPKKHSRNKATTSGKPARPPKPAVIRYLLICYLAIVYGLFTDFASSHTAEKFRKFRMAISIHQFQNQ